MRLRQRVLRWRKKIPANLLLQQLNFKYFNHRGQVLPMQDELPKTHVLVVQSARTKNSTYYLLHFL